MSVKTLSVAERHFMKPLFSLVRFKGWVVMVSILLGSSIVLTADPSQAQQCYKRDDGTTICCDGNGNCSRR